MQEAPALFARTYSGFGFVSLMAQTGLDPWSRLTGMLGADGTGGDLTAYQTAVAGNEQQLLDAWAATYFRLPGYRADWDMRGACGPPADARTDPEPVGRRQPSASSLGTTSPSARVSVTCRDRARTI
jgi:hypothetical protein